MRKLFIDSSDVLVIFAEAQARVVVTPFAQATSALGFSFPQKGKSGLTAPRNQTDAERKAKRSVISARNAKKYLADPVKAERIRALRRARVQRWRAKKTGAAP